MGVRTTNLTAESLADEVIVNRDGSTARQTITNLAAQIAGSGAVADALAAQNGRVTTLESGQASQATQIATLEGTADDHETRIETVEGNDTALDGRVTTLEGLSTVGYQFTAGGPVAVATTANITLSGEQTIDGVLTSASRVLVKDQTAPGENGIYVSASGAWARASDMDAAGVVAGTAVSVAGGTVGEATTWITYSEVTTLGTDAIEWVRGPDSGVDTDQITQYIDSLRAADEAAASRRNWEAMFAGLAAGKIGPGIIDPADHGIDDWQNTHGVKLYWTGSVIYPLRQVTADWHTGWEDGDITHIAADGTLWRSVSVALVNAPEYDRSLTLTEYHCDFEIGVDDLTAGRGASASTSWKTMRYAMLQIIAADLPFHLYVHGDIVGISSLYGTGSPTTIPDDLVGQITGVPKTSGRTRTWFVPMRDAVTKAQFAWAEVQPGVWRSNSTAMGGADNVKKTKASVDVLYMDEMGRPLPVAHLGGVWANEAEAQAAVAARPNSVAWYGTTGSSLAILVHLIDGREPDPETWWHTEGTPVNTWLIGEGAKVFLRNMATFAWTATAPNAAIRARPVVVDTGARVEHTGQFWLYNYAVVGSSGNGIEFNDILGGWDYAVGAFIEKDFENIHSFYATTAEAGDYIDIWSGWTDYHHSGTTPFDDRPAAGNTSQASSCHDQARMTRINQRGSNSVGATAADVLGAQTWSFNCHWAKPVHGDGLASPNAAVWCSGALGGPAGAALSKMDLLLCSGTPAGDGETFAVTAGGTIRYAKQSGVTTSVVEDAGSALVDLDA